MAPTFCIGIDISKVTLDIAVLKDGTLLLTQKIDNTEAAIKQFLVRLKTHHQSTTTNTIFCAENMGLYGKFLIDVLIKKKARLCLESPLQIKLSLGLQRSKSDLLDAIRIAEYAYKNLPTLKFWTPPRPPIEKLKTLMTIRKKLIKMRIMVKASSKLESYYLSASSLKEIGLYTKSTIAAIKADIVAIEKEMTSIIHNDPQLNDLAQLVTSVPCIGNIIATEILIITNEFKYFRCPKKFASYCGIAPFAKTSGTSLNRRPRVSPIADKNMKSLLHLAALGTLKSKGSKLQTYYARKVEEGKNKTSTLNAIRNKLVAIIFACVREKRMYMDAK